MQPEQYRPFGENVPNAAVLDNDVVASVAGLSLACRPHAVLWGISAAVVGALDGMMRAGPRTHVGHVIDESLGPSPAIANGYAASAISRVVAACGAMAARDHAVPAVPVGSAGLTVHDAQAPARFCRLQVHGADDGFTAALTPTKPLRMTKAIAFHTADQRQPSDNLSGSIFWSTHARYRKTEFRFLRRKSIALRVAVTFRRPTVAETEQFAQ